MKASKYNIIVDSAPGNQAILFNSLYGSLTMLDVGELATVRSILADPANGDEDAPLKRQLLQQKHLIDDGVDEMAVISDRKLAGVRDENRLDLIVMPTLDCNFACSYCYEEHRPSMMSGDTEDAIRRWLSQEIPKHKVMLLNWFGGEPLLAYHRVVSLSRYAMDKASEAHTVCTSHMTTNGYLLTAIRIKELVDCGIYDYQITLDGPCITHDRFRVLKNGQGTFHRIFQNILILARADERVKISLRINFNHNNLHQIPELLDEFPSDVRPQLRVVYEPIFGNCSQSATDNLPPDEIASAMTEYYRLAAELGYDVVLGLSGMQVGKLVYCYAERENQVIIDHDANIFKCSVSKFAPDQRVGYLRGDGVFVKEGRWSEWMEGALFEEQCRQCVYLPLCMGGCKSTRVQKQGTGSFCSLVPTNASYLLKQIAFGNLANVLRNQSRIPG